MLLVHHEISGYLNLFPTKAALTESGGTHPQAPLGQYHGSIRQQHGPPVWSMRLQYLKVDVNVSFHLSWIIHHTTRSVGGNTGE